jgi:two-component system, OmpR family, KDP operon response regulator KdpE
MQAGPNHFADDSGNQSVPRRTLRTVGPLVLVGMGERRARADLRAVLSQHGMRVLESDSGSDTLSLATSYNPDLILLGLQLPDCDAVHLTTTLRTWTVAPILIVSGPCEESERIAVLDAGANVALTKPFGTSELLARIRVWMRHTQRSQRAVLSSTLDVGPMRIDFDRRLAFLDGRHVRLTPMQYRLFATMMRNAGKVMTREQILVAVWGPGYTREKQYLRVYMGQLRRKFEIDAAEPRYFVTERHVGYRLRTECL